MDLGVFKAFCLCVVKEMLNGVSLHSNSVFYCVSMYIGNRSVVQYDLCSIYYKQVYWTCHFIYYNDGNTKVLDIIWYWKQINDLPTYRCYFIYFWDLVYVSFSFNILAIILPTYVNVPYIIKVSYLRASYQNKIKYEINLHKLKLHQLLPSKV